MDKANLCARALWSRGVQDFPVPIFRAPGNLDPRRAGRRFAGFGKIVFVEAVGNQHDGGLRLRAEVRGDGRADADHRVRAVQHGLLEPVVPAVGSGAQPQVLVVEHLRPRITEIRYPAQPEGLFQAQADQVHGVRRPRGDHGVHGMLRQILLQETDRGTHPADPGVGHETVAPHPQRQALLPVLLLRVHGIHLALALLPAGQAAVEFVRFEDPRLDDLRAGGDVREQALVTRQLFGVFRGIDHRLPAELRQVLAELHPALHPRPAGRWPVVGDDQQAFHRL